MHDCEDTEQNIWLTIAVIVALIIIFAMGVAVSSSKKEPQQAKQSVNEKNSKSNLIMDSSILESRAFIKEFDEKVELATTESKMCFDGDKSSESIDRCMIMMYDKHNIRYRYENRMVQIERNLYDINLKNASKKLSTEL